MAPVVVVLGVVGAAVLAKKIKEQMKPQVIEDSRTHDYGDDVVIIDQESFEVEID